MQAAGKAVAKVQRGDVLTVESVKGNWLWVRKEKFGWIHVKNVTSGELQGAWIVRSAEEAGKPTDEPVGDKVVFAGVTMSIEPKVKKAPPVMTVSTDVSKSPRQIDLAYVRNDKTLTTTGVYSVKDDTLRLCLSPPNSPRPDGLESQADTKQISLVLTPEKVAAPERFVSLEPLLGEIRIVGFNFAPRGWAFCDGQTLPIQQHQSLFSILGTTYGGDGRTTFGLPDLRGRVPVHAGEAPGSKKVAQGEKLGGEKVALVDDGKARQLGPISVCVT